MFHRDTTRCAGTPATRRALVVGLALMVAVAAISTPAGAAGAASDAPTGIVAPAFTLTATDGRTVSLADHEGQIVVLHFATSWCPFCTAEAPHLEQLWQDFRGDGVQVLTIDVGESDAAVAAWMERQTMTFPILFDRDGAVATAYAPEGVLEDLPRDQVVIASNLVIDRQGRIAFFSLLDTTHFDARLTALRATVERLLQQP